MLMLLPICTSVDADWRQFRGTHNNSVSPEKNLPVTFADDEHKQNVFIFL